MTISIELNKVIGVISSLGTKVQIKGEQKIDPKSISGSKGFVNLKIETSSWCEIFRQSRRRSTGNCGYYSHNEMTPVSIAKLDDAGAKIVATRTTVETATTKGGT